MKQEKESKLKPPRLAEWIVQRLAWSEDKISIKEDLREEYEYLFTLNGSQIAHFWYWKHVFRSIFPFLKISFYWSFTMLKNYLKTTLRNFRKQRTYSLISIFGFSLGITSCLLIMLYVKQELSYDRFHTNADRIYRVGVETRRPQGRSLTAATPIPVAPALKEDYPDIEHFTRIYFAGNDLVQYEDKKFFESSFVFIDPGFFKIFSFPLIKGSALNLMEDPGSIVITSSIADKYFGDKDPIGEIIRYRNQFNFTVAGVIEDVPTNSHFHFDFAASFLALNQDIVGFTLDQWGAYADLYTYVLLPEHLNADEFQEKVQPFLQRHHDTPGVTRELFLQPLTGIHLHSHVDGEIEKNNFVSNLVILITIAFFILTIAIINYINLSTAHSSRRAKEVGMRKVLGAVRFQLFKQFMGESICLSFLSMCLSLVFIKMLLPVFSSMVGKPVEFVYSENLLFLGAILMLSIFVGVISSIYPALFLSGFQPVKTLKGLKDTGKSSFVQLFFRKALVVTQFVISLLLIIGTLVINQQIRFLKNANLGFDKEQMVIIPFFDNSVNDKYETVKNELAAHPNVISAAACFNAPIGESNGFAISVFPDGKDAGAKFVINMNIIDFDFIDSFGLEIIAGRNFSKEFTSDYEKAFIVNEAALKDLDYASPEDAIGKKFIIGINFMEGTVIGVVRDFHITSLHEDIGPLLMLHKPEWFNSMAVKIRPDDISGTLTFLEKTWKKFVPNYPFSFSFLDERIDLMYQSEKQTSIIIRTFSMIAIVIACLGLFGLAAYTAEKRTKEIGIRKVLGATVGNLIFMLSTEFTKWVLVANVVAWPVAYFAMNKWLGNFAYRTSIGLAPFILAAVLVFLIALFTVSFQALKTALANPIESLRYE